MLTTANNNRVITSGSASRYIKNTWLKNVGKVDATAFDLRDCAPPETYVSFFLVQGNDNPAKIDAAIVEISKRRTIKNGAIIVLEIEACLEQINDERDDLILFQEEGLPHCGLHYLTRDYMKLTEIKNTLSFLALECFRSIISPSTEVLLEGKKALPSK